jgi:hypothetical protein
MKSCWMLLWGGLWNLSVLGAPERSSAVADPRVLPLALEDGYLVEKVFVQTLDPTLSKASRLPLQLADADRRYYGAINQFERRRREGNYYTVRWRAPKGSDLTVRLEYRQQKLGTHVQALDSRIEKSASAGTVEFSVTGEDYYDDGPVVAWRVLLIREGRIVGLQQSFLW